MELKLPIFIVNFKTYATAIGGEAEKLAMICEKVAKDMDKSVAVSVSPTDIYRVAQKVSIPVFSERVDAEGFGSHTGKIIPEDIKVNNAVGSLVNHSEDRLRFDIIKSVTERLRSLGLVSCLCANDAVSAKALAVFLPDMIAVEPPELIGGDVSVSSAKPEVITNTVNYVKSVADVPVLCGAGVNSHDDVKKALELGAQGILIASAITKAKDPEEKLRELLSAFP